MGYDELLQRDLGKCYVAYTVDQLITALEKQRSLGRGSYPIAHHGVQLQVRPEIINLNLLDKEGDLL